MKLYIPTKAIPPFHTSKRGKYFTATQKSNVYDAILAGGEDGRTRPQIAQAVGLPADRVSFYLSDLRRAGYIAVKGDVTGAVSPNMNAEEAMLASILGFEHALVARVREMPKGPTQEMEKAFATYSKLKELFLRPGTAAEGRTALRMGLTVLLKLVIE